MFLGQFSSPPLSTRNLRPWTANNDRTSDIADNTAADTHTDGGCTRDTAAEVYEVERIVGKRLVDYDWEYRVKWRNYASKDNSWVRFEDLYVACQRYVQTDDKIPILIGPKQHKRSR